MSEKIVVVAVHPDDETLGCGGTLLRHKRDGDEVHWMIVTRLSKDLGFTKLDIQKREDEIERVSKTYNFDSTHRLNIHAGKVDMTPTADLVKMFSDHFSKIEPSIVYLPFLSDAHSDHRAAFRAAFSATKNFRHPYINKILMMETQSETDFSVGTSEVSFSPNYYVNITDLLHSKIEIAKIYESEFKNHPFPRSVRGIEALATVRGAAAGCEFAEAFQLLKERLM